jgi:hypothetical protein
MKYNAGGELVQGTLYLCTGLTQWNSLILVMYANSKIKLKKKSMMYESQGWWLTSVTLVTWEEVFRTVMIQGQSGQKLRRPPSQPIRIWVWWCTPVIPATSEVPTGGSRSRPAGHKCQTLSQK